MEFINNDATFAANQETQFDYKQGTSTTSRMSHVSYASNNWGFKFYTYQNFLNSTPTLTLRGDNLNGINTASPLANWHVQGVTGNNPFRVDDGAAGISLMVLNGGNVGIGTTTPTTKLEVAGGRGLFRDSCDVIGDGGIIMRVINSGSSDTWNFDNNRGLKGLGGSFMSINSNTTDSNVQLLIKGSVGGNPLFVTDAGATASGILSVNNDNFNVGMGIRNPVASARLQVVGNTYISGNVGIGTTTPSQKLEVAGNTKINGTTFISVSGGINALEVRSFNSAVLGLSQDNNANVIHDQFTHLKQSVTLGTTITGVGKLLKIDNDWKIEFGNTTIENNIAGANETIFKNATGDFIFRDAVGNSVNFEANASGGSFAENIGIGTATPTQKLEVNGNTHTTGQGSFGTGINPNSHLQVTASGKIVGIAGTSNAITANNGAAIRGTANSTAAVEVYGVDGGAEGTNATGDRTGVRGNAITTGSRNHVGVKGTGTNGIQQNIGLETGQPAR
jgi:hypothetical protein